MKVAIIFYSFSGNTKKACLFLKEKLIEKNVSVGLIELKPKEEETSFFKQGLQAFLKKKIKLKEVEFDLEKYDFVIFASAVWAFTITPALATYLENVKNLKNKKTACFLTFGSGAGSKKALKELENILREKGAHILFSRNLAGKKTEDKNYLEENFKSLLEIINF
jgi:flavorubredoxin